MSINETDIRQWADRHECRRSLPILVRRLIRETAGPLSAFRFPGNDAVDLSGLDGQVENEIATTWVPCGRSVWEMGSNHDPRAKAEGDYKKRTAETPLEVRQATSFIFVTPRRWNTKDEWLEMHRQEASWASVEAYDAIDLETWLEEAPVTTRWLEELIGIAHPGLMTPQEWWKQWSTASNPAISMKLVSTRRHNEQQTLLSLLRDGEEFLPIQADDRQEAVAFVIASLIEADALDLLDRTLVLTANAAEIQSSPAGSIIISDAVEGNEPNFGDRRKITIIKPYPKGRSDVRQAIQLSHVPSQIFRTELEAMGLSRDEAASWALKTGHSVPVLRRQLSKDPDVRTPTWARNRASAKMLFPFALAGSWVERENTDDETVLQLLGELGDREVERIRDELLALNDAPVARYGNINIVVSQLDALFAVGPFIGLDDLDRFFQLVPELLGDRDPVLDLPQDQWWMASVLGKTRDYSNALLSGLSDALCILSIHGKEICGNRLSADLARRSEKVVRSLMKNNDEDRWLSIRDHLRKLAEASPSAFLDCLEEELGRSEPTIRAIMGTTTGAIGGECLRTHLLWALESLAWHPEYFKRVLEIFFKLRDIETEDNWINSPKSTARALFLPWLPATSVSVIERMVILRELSKIHRRHAIDVCISLLPGAGPNFASRTARPRWRALEIEVPEPTNADVKYAAEEASHLLLDLAPFDKEDLKQLIEITTLLYPDDLSRLVHEVERWSAKSSDEEKAELRHDLRRRDVMCAYQENEKNQALATAIHQMEAFLEPANPSLRHRWLFGSHPVEWRALAEAEIEGNLSWQERAALLEERRQEAISEIQEHLGEEAILPFALSTQQPDLVAETLVPHNSPAATAGKWASIALQEKADEKSNAFLRQILWNTDRGSLIDVGNSLTREGLLSRADSRERFAQLLPGCPEGWKAAESLGDDIASSFWRSASIRLWNETEPQVVVYAVEKLLEVQRPRSALSALQFQPGRLLPEHWSRILQAVARGEEPQGPLPSSYHLDEIFMLLDNEEEISDQHIAHLELPFVPLLCSHGYRNHQRTLAIHRELSRDPALFVQLLCWRYKRRDGAHEPEHNELSDDRREFLASLARHTLKGWKKLPGCQVDGIINEQEFTSWADEALRRASDADRREAGETHFAELLAHFARQRPSEDWLPDCVLRFLDRRINASLREKLETGVHNARGATIRGPYDGGEQERNLASHYRDLAARYGNSYPRVSAMLISIAESYERDARRHDEQAAVGERWHP